MPSPVFRNPPRLKYCGVTIELSHAGRFDSHELISGSSAYALVDALAGQGVSRYTFDVRTQACTDPYMPGTRVVLLAGNPAKLGHPLAKLGAVRGSPTVGPNGVIFIPTFHPQDCADLKNYEATLNPDSITAADAETEDDDNEGDAHVKDMGRTSRRNYRFWFIHDTHKALDIARNGLRQNKAAYHTHPSAEQIIAALSAAHGKELFIDIETDPRSGRMLCFAFSVNATEIWCVPIITHDGKLAYAETSVLLILRALATAFIRCTVVAHNSLFDLFILLWRYKIVPPAQMRIRDTMLQHARLHVDTEKSLGHCVSLYTHQPYHKDEGIFCPSNYAQYKQLLEYNAKDVETTALIHAAQWRTEDEGARASMAQANALVRPLLLKSFRGLPTDTGALCKLIDSHHARAAWIEQNVLQPLANNQPCNPRSPKQVAKLLYEDFGLPKSSDPTISLTGKDALYKLALKYPIPALKVILHIRHLSKEAGQISCRLWRNSRITCAYVITGTKTFRLSSRKLLGTFGTNTQNWNKKTRKLIVAPPGYTLVQVDQAGAEALVVAYIAPAGRFRDLFLNGIKSHTYVAVHLFREVWEAELGESIADIINAPIAQVRAQKRWSELEKLIKKSDDNPPSRRYYYLAKQTCHCFPPGYQVLTPSGWMNIEDCPQTIASWSPDKIEFQQVSTWNIGNYTGKLFKFEGEEFEQSVTPDHKLIHFYNKRLQTRRAQELFQLSPNGIKIPVTGLYAGGNVNESKNILALTLALQADGYIPSDCDKWSFRFGKDRKINRLKEILTNLGRDFNETIDVDGYTKIRFYAAPAVFKYLSSDKLFNWESFLALNTECLDFVLDEVFRWDGSPLKNFNGRKEYRTTVKHNAELIYTLLKMRGHGSTLYNKEGVWIVSVNVRQFSGCKWKSLVDYSGPIYCPTVPSGAFLVRSPNGKISVTHNSANYGIKAPRFVANILDKSEGQISLPVHMGERFLSVYHGLFPEIENGFQAYVVAQLQTRKELRNLFGYPRRFYGQVTSDTVKKDAFSWIPQSTVGCITCRADSELQAEIDSNPPDTFPYEILQNNHDSLLALTPLGTEAATAKRIRAAMNQRMVNHRGEEFFMRSEATSGPDWYSQQPIKGL